MKTVYIRNDHAEALNEYMHNLPGKTMFLTEESGSVRKAVKDIIARCFPEQMKNYLDMSLNDPFMQVNIKPQVCHGGTEPQIWNSVANHPTQNKFIDFLRANLYSQLNINRDRGPIEYIKGAARIMCNELGFYSWSEEELKGGDIIKFVKLLNAIHDNKKFFLDNGHDMNCDMDGMSYHEFMNRFAPKYNQWREDMRAAMDAENYEGEGRHRYRVIPINDEFTGTGCMPIGNSLKYLLSLGQYCDWCICIEDKIGQMYPQYTGGGGKVYVLERDDYRDVERVEGEGCPLDEYGLSLICVIVGPDGMPDNITTRWNHNNGGENPEGLRTAIDLQRVTHIRYNEVFKPRSDEELAQMHMLSENETPSAMDQVHNKVNAGVMDAVTGGGMMEENNGQRLEKWYRGYKARYGSQRTHLLWAANDIGYARMYGNRVEEFVIDMNKLNAACGYEIDDVLGYEFDTYDDMSEEDVEKMSAAGFGGYEYRVTEDEGYDCLCFWDQSAIVSRRELSKDEFEAIERYYDDIPNYDDDLSEGAEPESDEYTIAGEGGNNEYFHVNEGKKSLVITEEQWKHLQTIVEKENIGLKKKLDEAKIGDFDFKKYFEPIAEFMDKDGLNVKPYPKVKLDWSEQDGLFIKTGYYEPESKTITIFCDNRHPKDILRTYCHEMIHHSQNLDGVDLNFSSKDDVKDNERLEEIESEAYLKGNVYFRKWTEYQNKQKYLLQEGKKHVIKNDKGEIVPEKCDECGGKVMVQIKGEPVYVCTKCGKYFGTMPCNLNESVWNGAGDEFQLDKPHDVPPVLYHISPPENREMIMKHGIWPNVGEEYGNWWCYNGPNDEEADTEELPELVFLSDNPETWGNILGFVAYDTYAVDTSKLDKNSIYLDPTKLLAGKGCYCYDNTIPTEAIKLIHKCDEIDEDTINESTDPEDIDLSSFNIKTALNPKFWKDEHLDSRIRMKLLDIADDFVDFLGVDWVKPDDVIMTGSLANYNWNKKYSDIDLHILIDYSKVDKRKDFVDNYFYSQKKLWNDEHKDLKIFGFPVELYVQDTNEKHASTGVYSLDKDKWIVEPERERLKNSKVNKTLIKNKVADYIDKIEEILTIYKKANDNFHIEEAGKKAKELFEKIKGERKGGLNAKNNEMSNGNIIFKCLRRLGYIEKLTNLIGETYDKINSLS